MEKPVLEKCLLIKIKRSRKTVFLRKNFEKLAGYDQVGRTLTGWRKKVTLLKLVMAYTPKRE